MAVYILARYIAAPPERVFALAVDFASAPAIFDNVVAVEMLTEGEVGVGTKFRETRIMFGRRASEVMEVLEIERPNRFALGCTNNGCRYRTDVTLEATEDGGTDYLVRFEAEPLTFFARCVSFLTKPMVKYVSQEMEKDVDDLERAVVVPVS